MIVKSLRILKYTLNSLFKRQCLLHFILPVFPFPSTVPLSAFHVVGVMNSSSGFSQSCLNHVLMLMLEFIRQCKTVTSLGMLSADPKTVL